MGLWNREIKIYGVVGKLPSNKQIFQCFKFLLFLSSSDCHKLWFTMT